MKKRIFAGIWPSFGPLGASLEQMWSFRPARGRVVGRGDLSGVTGLVTCRAHIMAPVKKKKLMMSKRVEIGTRWQESRSQHVKA